MKKKLDARSIPTTEPEQEARNTEVGRELAAMTARVQGWVVQFGPDYLRHQYSAEFEKLVRVVVAGSEENSLLDLNQDSFQNLYRG